MEIPQTKPLKPALAFVLMVIFASPRGPSHPCHVLLGLTFLARDRSTKAFVLSAHLGNSKISQAKQVASRAGLGATPQHPEASRVQVAQLVATARTLLPPLLRLHSRHVLRVPSTADWASRQQQRAMTAPLAHTIQLYVRAALRRARAAPLARTPPRRRHVTSVCHA